VKKVLSVLLLFILLSALLCAAFANEDNIYFQIPVKLLHEEPSEESPVAFEIPIDVTLLGMTPDKNWYKVRIEYDLVFLGHYVYTGWVKAPIGKYLLEKSGASTR
jgi:hypothetical protein